MPFPVPSTIPARARYLFREGRGPAGDEPPAPAAHPLLALLHAAPHSSEGLAAALGWPLPEVLAALTELELDGLVCNQAGRWLGRSG